MTSRLSRPEGTYCILCHRLDIYDVRLYRTVYYGRNAIDYGGRLRIDKAIVDRPRLDDHCYLSIALVVVLLLALAIKALMHSNFLSQRSRSGLPLLSAVMVLAALHSPSDFVW